MFVISFDWYYEARSPLFRGNVGVRICFCSRVNTYVFSLVCVSESTHIYSHFFLFKSQYILALVREARSPINYPKFKKGFGVGDGEGVERKPIIPPPFLFKKKNQNSQRCEMNHLSV